MRCNAYASPFSMAKRKIGGYEISDPDDSHSESESVPAKKAKSYAPPMLTKAVFKLPIQPPSSSRPSGLSSHPAVPSSRSRPLDTPSRKSAAPAPADAHISFPTPCETPTATVAQPRSFSPIMSGESCEWNLGTRVTLLTIMDSRRRQ